MKSVFLYKFKKMRILCFILILVISTFSNSCKKKCDCNKSWDSSVTYYKNDLVLYDGKCWIALAQGKAIEPGPWLQNGNDIWEECKN